MDRLWAPWRLRYIQGINSENAGGCIFCTKPEEKADRQNVILYRGLKNFVILNIYPYNNGHLMVVPYQHTSDFADLDQETTTEMWQLVVASKKVLETALHPDGFNIGMNIGRVAGAGIDQHLHMHIVPRWNGDTNFMPVVGETKVISQSLEEAYDALAPRFSEVLASS